MPLISDLFLKKKFYKLELPSEWFLIYRTDFPDPIEYSSYERLMEHTPFFLLSYCGGIYSTRNYSVNLKACFTDGSIQKLVFHHVEISKDKDIIISLRVLQDFENYPPIKENLKISEVEFKDLPLYLNNCQPKMGKLLCSL